MALPACESSTRTTSAASLRTIPFLRSILERLRRTRATLDGLTAADLAADEATELTDQNHVGGMRFVRELAEAVGLRREHRVLDLGCGLGGSARIMAALYECQVHGIDFSDKRVPRGR